MSYWDNSLLSVFTWATWSWVLVRDRNHDSYSITGQALGRHYCHTTDENHRKPNTPSLHFVPEGPPGTKRKLEQNCPKIWTKLNVKRLGHQVSLRNHNAITVTQQTKIVQGNIKKGPPGTPIATRSRLGWLISGPIPGTEKDENFTSMVTVTKIDRVQEDLQRFWELDTMGIVERTMNKLSKKMMHYDSLKNHVNSMENIMLSTSLGKDNTQALRITTSKLFNDSLELKKA